MSELLAVKLWLQPTWPGVQLETTTRHDFSKRLFSPEVPNLRGADWYLLQDHSVLGQPQKTTLFLFIKRKCEIYFITKDYSSLPYGISVCSYNKEETGVAVSYYSHMGLSHCS